MSAGRTPLSGGGGGGVSSAAPVLEEIQTVTLDAPGVIRFDAIPQTYHVLEIRGLIRSASALSLSSINVEFNDDARTLYSVNGIEVYGATVHGHSTDGVTNARVWNAVSGSDGSLADVANVFSAVEMTVEDYARTDRHKIGRAAHSSRWQTSAGNANRHGTTGFQWRSTDAITSLRTVESLAPGSSLTLYGRLPQV